MQKGYWVIRTYQSGAVGEKIKYWVSGDKVSKSKRRINSEIKKQEKNEVSAIRTAARLLNANFGKGDILLGLDYSDSGYKALSNKTDSEKKMSAEERSEEIYKAAEHEMRLFLRRVKRECEKQGIEFRYFAATSDMDGKTGQSVRVHHHLVINAEALEIAKDKWSCGGVAFDYLSGQPDYTPIAEYILKQARRIKDARKYVSSRNLERPQPKDRVAVNNSELRTPAKAVLVHRGEFAPGKPQYIRYVTQQTEKPQKKKPPAERKNRTKENSKE